MDRGKETKTPKNQIDMCTTEEMLDSLLNRAYEQVGIPANQGLENTLEVVKEMNKKRTADVALRCIELRERQFVLDVFKSTGKGQISSDQGNLLIPDKSEPK